MSLNITKLPYIIMVFLLWVYNHYLFHGLSIVNLVISGILTFLAFKYPHICCLYTKSHEYDEYTIMRILPTIILMAVLMTFSYTLANHIGYASMDLKTMIQTVITIISIIFIVDRSRYK